MDETIVKEIAVGEIAYFRCRMLLLLSGRDLGGFIRYFWIETVDGLGQIITC